MTKPEAQFLHQQNPNLHHSTEVEAVADYLRASGEHIPNDPAAKIEAHLGFLATRANDGILTGDQASIDRQVESHVIASDDVPESYFQLQQRIAREQGHGDIQITEQMREQIVESVQADQHASLSKWVEYIGAEGYPDWFKTYTWNAVTKLGQYNKDKGEFGKRSSGTTAAYPDLNREALAYVFDALQKGRIDNQPAEDERLQKLLQTANFGKLYVHALKETSPPPESLKQDIRGSWTKFDQTDDPRRARLLSNSLQGHGTGWCTAGESTAAMQLQGGDFYVYYTRDEEGKETIPRVAIRMQDGSVAEVRGINGGQELEPELADTTLERLKDLPGGEEYTVKAEDMKRLTAIEKLLADDPAAALSKDDVKFLYEIGHSIQGFGYDRDPRIDQLKKSRGELDHPLLKALAVEHIRESLGTSYRGYSQVAEILGVSANTEQELQHMYEAKLQEWTENGVLDYVAERMISHGELHTPVITPEGLFGYEQITVLAKKFGEQQPYETYIHDELYSQYSAAELSGSGDLRISLIPSKYDSELSRQNVETQRDTLHNQQSAAPELGLHVPSLLEALTYWQTLQATGDKLADSSTYEKTIIRHFDLEPKQLDRFLSVPRSCVNGVGQPYLNRSDAVRGDYSRLALG